VTLRLNPADPLSTVLTVAQAATVAGRTVRTVNRWIATGRLTTLPGRRVVERDVLAVEAATWAAGHAGRPGARPRLLAS
jgi:hypothetical protein